MDFLSLVEVRLAVALASGMLIGAERERLQVGPAPTSFAGLRTFGLTALLGGLFAHSSAPWMLPIGACIVGLTAIASYIKHRDGVDPGATTEIALVVTYALGALSMQEPILAASASVVVTALLASGEPMHKLLRQTLTKGEQRDALIFLLFALVVLPSAPDVHIGPYGALHPPSIARLVVVLMAITGAGYIAQRLLGPRFGLTITGFAAGFVSSSATIAALGTKAHESDAAWKTAASGALASNVATVVQYALVLTTLDPALALSLAPSLGLSGLVAVLSTLALTRLAARNALEREQPGRAFRLWFALAAASIACIVSIAASALHERIGRLGILAVSSVAALVDAHSTAGSVASLHTNRSIDTQTAQWAILAALSSNSLTKLLMASTGRHLKYALSVSLSVVLIALAAWLPLLIGW